MISIALHKQIFQFLIKILLNNYNSYQLLEKSNGELHEKCIRDVVLEPTVNDKEKSDKNQIVSILFYEYVRIAYKNISQNYVSHILDLLNFVFINNLDITSIISYIMSPNAVNEPHKNNTHVLNEINNFHINVERLFNDNNYETLMINIIIIYKGIIAINFNNMITNNCQVINNQDLRTKYINFFETIYNTY